MATLEITTRIGCPLMCTFCPQKTLRTAYDTRNGPKYLTFDTFRKSLGKVPAHVRIDFSGMAEPWSNPDCTAFLKHTLETGFKVGLYTTLTGITATNADSILALLRAHDDQVDALCLHLPDRGGNMRGWTESQEWRAVFAKFYAYGTECGISRFHLMTMDRSGRLPASLDDLRIRTESFYGQTRAGNIDKTTSPDPLSLQDTPDHTTAVSCGKSPFYDHNVLLPNGDVALCSQDYGLTYIIGNLIEQDYYDLFKSEPLNRLRQENMKLGHSCATLCKSCTAAAPHDLKNGWQWTLRPKTTRQDAKTLLRETTKRLFGEHASLRLRRLYWTLRWHAANRADKR